MKKIILSLSLVFTFVFTSKSQIVITPDTNYVQLVNNFILSGVSASNVLYTGAPMTLGTFNNAFTTNLGMTDGIVLTTGTLDTTVNVYIGSEVINFANYMNGAAGDTQLDALVAPFPTYDASVLEFDLVPVGNILEFQYVFGSEEYPEFVGTSFNDVFGFFINGPGPSGPPYINENIAIIPGTTLPVSINNVNAGLNSAYFVDNQGISGQTIVFDGFTTVLTAQLSVTPLSTYHLKMAIADVGDGVFDSGIFLKAQSMKSYNYVGIDEIAENSTKIFPNPLNENSVLTINKENTGNIVIHITDCIGRTIFDLTQENNLPGKQSFPLGQILHESPSGIYFVNIQANGKSFLEKVVK